MTDDTREIAVTAPRELAERSGSANVMAMIAGAASDPAFNVDKLERLLALHEQMRARESREAYMAALAAVQAELPPIPERGKITNREGKTQSTYAFWEDVNEVIKPILMKHGLALSFRTAVTDAKVIVTGVLSHAAGHAEETSLALPSDTSGSKNAVQAVGSSVSYGKRYTAGALLNLTSRGEDDDGRAAAGDAPITDEQVQKLQDMIAESNSDIEKFCKFMAVESVPAIRAKDFEKAADALNKAIAADARRRAAKTEAPK